VHVMANDRAMERGELIARFREMASEIAEQDFGHVTEEHPIAELGMDSLSILELVGSMEREFDIRIPEEDLAGVETVRQLLELVERRLTALVA
jgi:acyl carrier protein